MATGYVRPARPGEAADIARIQLSTWRTAYGRLIPRSVLDGLDESLMAEQWAEAIASPPTPRHRVLIAVEQADVDHTVGFVASGPADDAALAPEEKPLPDGVAAVTELLVEPRWGRRGHGSRLLSAAVAMWRGDGFDTAVAWAYEQDPATRTFLVSAGWAPDGEVRSLDVDDLLVVQLRLHVALEEQAREASGAPE